MSQLIAIDASVQGAIVTTAGAVTVAAVGVVVELLRRQGRAISEVRDHAQEARDQVANTHSTNLRDDLDRVIAGLDRVLDGQARHEEALHDLRREVAHERSERLAVAERLDKHISLDR
ncbi:DUF2746 domain-containing protein [Kitasatospora sp. NPDC048540]|uniref:DUF2746 domain-containing protein n=1 Tax=Kitasatospora sp. NPDC048540 TaxID=3155634 RepID=UPI0034032278